MNWLDLIILLLLAASFVSGFRMGLIYKVGTLVGFILGVWIASRVVTSMLEQGAMGVLSLGGIFFLVLTLVRMVCGWIAYLLQKIFNIVAIIPGLKLVNRLFGGILSIIISILTIGIVLFLMRLVSLQNDGVLAEIIEASLLGNAFVSLAAFLPFLISDRLRTLLENPPQGL